MSYTLTNGHVLRNIFVEIKDFDESANEEKNLSITNDCVSEEVMSDFIEYHGDLSGPCLYELRDLSCKEIVYRLLELKSAWSVIYYNTRLGKCFIGRDIFGRSSIIYAADASSIILSALGRPTNIPWKELPHAQISVIDIKDVFSKLRIYSCLPNQCEDKVWTSFFSMVYRQILHFKDGFITVSRLISPTTSHICEQLSSHLLSAIRVLIPASLNSVGVCFSGGVDSTLISYLLVSISPPATPIYFINVAFGQDDVFIARAADRKRSIEAFSHIKERFPKHDLHLILVDVSKAELKTSRSFIIPLCARPSETVLDESIATVLHYAFMGIGIDHETKKKIRCVSPVRLMGSGADELFMGYSRHRNRYEKDKNSSGMAEEAEMELRRLGYRNGGRDSRVAILHNIETKSPFLYDDLVVWANGLSIEDKADLSLPRGFGEKKIIRDCLRLLNVPPSIYSYPKQAMQFGSGMVKMDNAKKQKVIKMFVQKNTISLHGSHTSTYFET